MKRHFRLDYFVVGEGILFAYADGTPGIEQPSTIAELRKYRFSRIGPKGPRLSQELRAKLAQAMTAAGPQPDSDNPVVPAGFTYLGQFVDHDLTLDRTSLKDTDKVIVSDLLSGRSPTLDLDCLYGNGPHDPESAEFYKDGVKFKLGKTAATDFPDPRTNIDLEGFDLPRRGSGSKASERRKAVIADHRNDENLAVAQTHLAMLRFHNRVVDVLTSNGTPSALLFDQAREAATKHYQWMLKTDYLPLIVDAAILDDVFSNGRRIFEPAPKPGDLPTMPIEFSVAAFRLGHAMIRGGYHWNRVFRAGAPGGVATLALLFQFSGTSGTLSPDSEPNKPDTGSFERLPTNWITDFRRLFDFNADGYPQFAVPTAEGLGNITKRIDTLLVDPLATLPPGSFGFEQGDPLEQNLAFRNLTRGSGLELASGQQMAQLFAEHRIKIAELTDEQILKGSGGAKLDTLDKTENNELLAATPLWFYVLREAEFNNGLMTGIGGRLVAETFHRAMEASTHSILRNPDWRPDLGTNPGRFRMTDLLDFAFEGKAELLNPLGR